jgi:3-phosphoshikimate 1-carboxyvinyltransferase
MSRIVKPLRRMGAGISGRQNNEIFPPLKIKGRKLRSIRYNSKIASAQVKSCILMAGLYAEGVTDVSEPVKSRDHTERMLREFGVNCRVAGNACRVTGPAQLNSPGKIRIPGDISSAAFFIVAGCILPGPGIKLVLKDVGLNPTRTGVVDILKRMGAKIQIANRASLAKGGEPFGDITVKSCRLKGVAISPSEVVRAIDEIPIIMAGACFAKGKTVIKGISELRVKETDRVKSMVTNLRKAGADIRLEGKKESIVINGGKPLHGARVSSYGDHRTAMSMLIIGRAVRGVKVTGLECIKKSFPGFEGMLRRIKLTMT